MFLLDLQRVQVSHVSCVVVVVVRPEVDEATKRQGVFYSFPLLPSAAPLLPALLPPPSSHPPPLTRNYGPHHFGSLSLSLWLPWL